MTSLSLLFLYLSFGTIQLVSLGCVFEELISEKWGRGGGEKGRERNGQSRSESEGNLEMWQWLWDREMDTLGHSQRKPNLQACISIPLPLSNPNA